MARVPRMIDEYLAPLSDDKRAELGRLRKIIKGVAPRAEECVSDRLPAFRLGESVPGGVRRRGGLPRALPYERLHGGSPQGGTEGVRYQQGRHPVHARRPAACRAREKLGAGVRCRASCHTTGRQAWAEGFRMEMDGFADL